MIDHVIYPLTGDPIHYGHLNFIELLSNDFEKVTVAFGINESKSPFFSVDERIELLKHNLPDSNIDIVKFDGLLVSFAKKINADAIAKCIRNSADYEYERNLYLAGKTQNKEIETLFYFANTKYENISSTMVKGLFKHGGFIHKLVPLNVKFEMEHKIKNQIIIGITGNTGVGKDYVTEKIHQRMSREYTVFSGHLDVNIIDFDKMIHEMYESLTDNVYIKMRQKIAGKLGLDLLDSKCDGNFFIDRKKLSNSIKNIEQLRTLSKIVGDELMELYKERVSKMNGIILLNCPYLIEEKLEYLCNNNIILIHCSESTQRSRLLNKGVPLEKIAFYKSVQFHYKTCINLIESKIIRDKFGNLIEVDTTDDFDEEKCNDLYNKIKIISSKMWR